METTIFIIIQNILFNEGVHSKKTNEDKENPKEQFLVLFFLSFTELC